MTVESQTKSELYKCKYCEREFRKESTLAVHLCEQKRRYQEEKEVGVQIGLQSYLKFYTMTQGSAKLKTYADFATSPYYKAFVKFGRCKDTYLDVNENLKGYGGMCLPKDVKAMTKLLEKLDIDFDTFKSIDLDNSKLKTTYKVNMNYINFINFKKSCKPKLVK